MLRLIVLSFSLALTTAAYSVSDQTVLLATNYDDFTKKFCSASRASQHIFVLPISVFNEQKSVTCKDGESKLRTNEPTDDPGHVVFNIDPPHGSRDSFDCDGKADIDMTTVAINCLPVSRETEEHRKE